MGVWEQTVWIVYLGQEEKNFPILWPQVLFVKFLNIWLPNHPLFVFSLGDQPFKLNQGPCKDRFSYLKKKNSLVLKTFLCNCSLSICSVLQCARFYPAWLNFKCGVHLLMQTGPTLFQCQKHIVTLCEGFLCWSALASFILWSTIQKKNSNWICRKFIIPTFPIILKHQGYDLI